MTTVFMYVNSRDRNIEESKSSTDFVINLRKTIRNINEIDITGVCIPNTIYTINTNNNKLIITYGIVGFAEYVYSLVLDEGNYTGPELATELQDKMTNVMSIANTETGGTWAVTYIEKINKFSITLTVEGWDNTEPEPEFKTVRVIITETQLSNLLGIGDGTDNDYSVSVEKPEGLANDETLEIPIGKQADLIPVKSLYITSKILTDSINTSYVSSLKKKVEITTENNIIKFSTKDSSGTVYTDERTVPIGTYTYETLALIISVSTTNSPTYPNNPPAEPNNFYVYLLCEFVNNRFILRPALEEYGFTLSLLEVPNSILPTIGFELLNEGFESSLTGAVVDLSVVNNVVSKINEVPLNGIIRSNNTNLEVRKYKPGLKFDSIDIQLRDEYDKIVDNGNVDWSFTIVASIN